MKVGEAIAQLTDPRIKPNTELLVVLETNKHCFEWRKISFMSLIDGEIHIELGEAVKETL